jgi:hypothetical protein
MPGFVDRPKKLKHFAFTLAGLFAFCVAIASNPAEAAAQSKIQSEGFAFAAPEECLAWVSWDERYPYEPASGNPTEKMMAEPEVAAFVDDLIARAGLMVPALDAGEDAAQTELLHAIGPKLANTIFKRSGCFFVESADFDRRGLPKDLKAALILDAGDDAASLASNIAKVMQQDSELVKANNLNFYRIALEDELEIVIGNAGNLLFLTTGKSIIDDVRKRMAAKSVPAWLKNFKSTGGVKHVSNLSYFNIRKIRSKIVRLVGREQAGMIAAMGFNNAETLESCTGLTDDGSFSRVLLTLDGRPEGILDLSGAKGLLDTDLNRFPADSLFASGVSFDMRRGFGWFNTLVLLMSNGRENLFEFVENMERETGVHLQHDIVENLGKSWTLHNGAGDGLLSGMTLATTVRDADALGEAADKVLKKVLLESRGNRYPPEFSRKKVGDHVITSISVRGSPLFVEPSWCITSDRLIVGLFPQAVETALKFSADLQSPNGPAAGKQKESLLSNQDMAFLRTSFAQPQGSSTLLAMTYVDTAANFEISYPYMQIIANISRSTIGEFTRSLPEKSANQVQKVLSGIRLPRARVIHRHLKPSLLAVRLTDTGLEFETTQTIPSLELGYAVPITTGALLPAVQSARAAARRVQSQNNMRQLILAGLNYESAYRYYPPAYTASEDGKKLLSWRVHILPFIEQNALYKQFKLDEPWNSPHNIALLEQMPDLFRSPVSNAKKGMTVYRGVGGKQGVFRSPIAKSNKGTSIANVIDGTSNTIYLVEASDELAVEWTKPSDGLDPESFDAAKLFGLYPDGTSIAMCDGSVRFVENSTDPETLKKMMTIQGREITPRPESYRGQRTRRRSRSRSRNKPSEPVDPRFKLGASETLKLEDMLNDADRVAMARTDAKNQVRVVALAMHNFSASLRNFPSAYSTDGSGKPLLSWRVHILPFIGESRLHQQFRLHEPWDSEHNRALLKQMPDVYRPAKNLGIGKTCLVGNGGPEGLIRKPAKDGGGSRIGLGFRDISDGTSNTILIINAPDQLATEWTKPEEFVVTEENLQSILSIAPAVALADGSAHVFKSTFPVDKFKAMLSIAGGEVIRNMEADVE